MPEVSIDGRKVKYHDLGKGKAIVYLHGWPLEFSPQTAAWARQLRGYRLIAPVLPGFGSSECLPKSDIDSYVNFLHDFLSALGVKKVILMGASFGGLVSLRYAAQYPVKRLVLIGIDTEYAISPLAKYLFQLADSIDRLFPGLVEAVVKKLILDNDTLLAWLWTRVTALDPAFKSFDDDPSIKAVRQIPLAVSRELLKSGITTDLKPDGARITVPTLIINGRHDSIAGVDAGYRASSLIRNSEVFISSGAHYNLLDDVCLEKIRRFANP